MKKIVFAACCVMNFSFAVSSSASDTIPIDTGNYWYTLCTSKDAGSKSMCTAFVLGMSKGTFVYGSINEGKKLYCIPEPGVSYKQSEDIFIKYLNDNPAVRHLDPAILYIHAMGVAFPCPKEPVRASPAKPLKPSY